MSFPFSLVIAVFAFSCGTAIAALFYSVIKKSQKSKKSKQVLFLFSLSIIICCVVLYLVFFKSEFSLPFKFLQKNDFLFIALCFVLGGLFLFFTKICFVTFVIFYALISFFTFTFLNSTLTQNKNFQLVVNSYEQIQTVNLNCYKLKPYVLLPIPRIWYKNSTLINDVKKLTEKTEQEKWIKPMCTFVKKILLEDFVQLNAELPKANFYPAVFNIKIKTTLTNVLIKVEQAY